LSTRRESSVSVRKSGTCIPIAHSTGTTVRSLNVCASPPGARPLASSPAGPWGAQVRTDPADLINAVVDALVRHRFELPSLDTLTRLARRVHSQVNTAQWQRVGALLKEVERAALEALLVVDPTTQESPFALICRAPGRATRKNLVALIDRHEWLQRLPDPSELLQKQIFRNACGRLRRPRAVCISCSILIPM
jgi:hypothetical protein